MGLFRNLTEGSAITTDPGGGVSAAGGVRLAGGAAGFSGESGLGSGFLERNCTMIASARAG